MGSRDGRADFGAFVEREPGVAGLVHISELADHRVNTVNDIVKEGDTVKVKVLAVDDRGKIRLSMKSVNQETGEDLTASAAAADAGSGD